MKNLFEKSTLVVVVALLCLSCMEDQDVTPTGGDTKPRAAIAPSGFSLWTTCGSGPYISGSNVIVPLGTGCGTKYAAAQARNSIYGSKASVDTDSSCASGFE
jgi:hypothetical protein